MTLIEIMVSLTIMALIFAASAYLGGSIGNTRLQSEAMHMAGAIRYVHGRSAVNGLRYQLTFDLENQSWSAECSNEGNPLRMGVEAQERARRQRGIAYRDQDSDDDPFSSGETGMQECNEALLTERSMQGGVEIDRVLTVLDRDPIKDGRATMGFYPDGFVDRTMIWLRRGSGVTTLVVDPMTGRVHVFADDLDIPREFYDEEEER